MTEREEKMTPPGRKDTGAAPVKVPPPFLFFLTAGGTLTVEFTLLSTPFLPLPPAARLLAAAPLLMVSAWLVMGSYYVMLRAKTDITITGPTRRLVTSGPFRWTRNPLYLSLLMGQAALGIILNSLLCALGTVALWWLIERLAVLPEEKYLGELFGRQYAGYRRRVPRWW